MSAHEGFRDDPEIPRFGSDENDTDWSNSPEMDAQEEAVADEVYPPPEYSPDEEPDEDFPSCGCLCHNAASSGNCGCCDDSRESKEQAEREYEKLLGETRKALSEVNQKLHEHMMALPGRAGNERWDELYILTRHIHALADTIRMYQRHEYPPF